MRENRFNSVRVDMLVEQNNNGKWVRLGHPEYATAQRMTANGVFVDDAQNDAHEIANANNVICAARNTGISTQSRLRTPEGLIAVGDLEPGRFVSTSTGGVARILHILETPRSKSALRIRAPYFGLEQDIIIGTHNTFDVTDELAEYMFSAPRIRIPAYALRDNRRIHHYELTSRETLVHLHLDTSDGFAVGRSFMSPFISANKVPGHRVLNDTEARAFAAEQKLGRYN
ncbi:MAG: Hint domain-containing protein [Litoreibacter sp.]